MQSFNIGSGLSFSENVLMCYTGPVSTSELTFFTVQLDKIIKAKPLIFKKIHKIMMELAHNVSKYSAKKKQLPDSSFAGVGTVVVLEYDNCYNLTTENLILVEHGEKLIKHCTEINRLSKTELRKLKHITRNHSEGQDVGAHIGLIQIGILSSNLIDFEVRELDNGHSYFSITAKINKIYS